MKKYTLKCFENFKCTSSACSDNCCIGWEIGIDKKTLDFYKGVKDEKVKNNIDFKSSSIIMKKDGRCPFLNENNLCDIILKYGEENISYICTHHPRFYNDFGDFTEFGYGLCCEEACRLLFTGDVLCETGNRKDEPLFLLREKLFLIINDKKIGLKEKIYSFLDFICEADEVLFLNEDLEVFIKNYRPEIDLKEKNSIEPILKILKNTEPIDNKWTEYIDKVILKKEDIEKNIDKVSDNEKYVKLFYYYIFRYFLKESEYDIIERGKFIIFLVLSNIIFDVYSYLLNENKYLTNSVVLSKQLEYSQDNIDYILNECLENPDLDFEKITSYI